MLLCVFGRKKNGHIKVNIQIFLTQFTTIKHYIIGNMHLDSIELEEQNTPIIIRNEHYTIE